MYRCRIMCYGRSGAEGWTIIAYVIDWLMGGFVSGFFHKQMRDSGMIGRYTVRKLHKGVDLLARGNCSETYEHIVTVRWKFRRKIFTVSGIPMRVNKSLYLLFRVCRVTGFWTVQGISLELRTGGKLLYRYTL